MDSVENAEKENIEKKVEKQREEKCGRLK